MNFRKMFFIRIIRRIKYIPSFIKQSFNWEYESCKICSNSFRIMWHVNDNIWQKVMNINDDGGGSLCVDCFIKKAEKQGIIIKESEIQINLFYSTD